MVQANFRNMLQDHDLCMLCMESKDQESREHVTVKLGKCKSPTAMVDNMKKYHKEGPSDVRSSLE